MCKLQHINGKFYLNYTAVILQLQITSGGTVDAFAALLKAGTVTGAVPGVFLGIPFQRAAQMGAAPCCGCQHTDHGFPTVGNQLGRNIEREGENTSAKGCSFS